MRFNTPKEIARLLAGSTTLLATCCMLPVLILFGEYKWTWFLFILLLFTIMMASFYIGQYIIEKFVHNRIKLIYKAIHRFKTQKKSSKDIDFNKDVIREVNKEVISWARDNRDEINELKKQAEFRKEFIGNLAHELKTPAFSIQGYLLTLLEGGLEDPQINREYLKRADKNLDRLISLVCELDEITKLESGESPLSIEKFDIIELAHEVIDEVEYKAKRNNIEIDLVDPGRSFSVEADKDKISQVITNLLVNSIKYGKEGGKTRMKFYDMDENILIEVEDNGVGIAQEHLSRLFERFYRVDKSRSRHQGGSGLGLSIVKHIIDAHKQSINVRSKENEGSTFSFTLAKS